MGIVLDDIAATEVGMIRAVKTRVNKEEAQVEKDGERDRSNRSNNL